MDLREALKFDGIEEEINHWWIKTRFNYINEIIEYHNSNNLTIVEYGCGTGNNIYHLINRSPFSSKIKSIPILCNTCIDAPKVIAPKILGVPASSLSGKFLETK